ncbi:VirB4 family type IV secretion system protein [Halobacillus sp. Marseille-Q1614]|uniref:VirB4 family type IV secretion system protein n=1 Tax=Halobacillus sp. Marseille-Q1614 TaxID=2709134 RepID=UPI00156F4B61|nr:DUF87 domain-containing protein [Halobacillus sp. Marseille-Q1614]
MKKQPFGLLSKVSKKAKFKKKFFNIPVEEFDSEIIRTSDGKFKTVLKVIDPLNVNMMGEKEIRKAIKHTQSALNALNPGERCQMLITSDEVDISQYIQELEKKQDNGNKTAIADYKNSMIEGKKKFLQDYAVKARNTHNFYLVLESKEKKHHDATAELLDLMTNVVEHLEKAGLKIGRLSEEKVKAIIYNRLTPNSNRQQPYEEGMDLTAWQPPDIATGNTLEIDDLHYSFYSISYFPKEIGEAWMDPILTARVNVDVSVSLQVVSKNDQMDRINSQIRELERRIAETKAESVKQRYEDQIKSSKRLLDRISDDSENLFRVTFIFGVKANDKEDLHSLCNRFETNIKSNRMKANKIKNNPHCLWYMLPIGYKNTNIETRYGWPMYTELIGAMLPFNASEFNYNTGLLQGINVKSESPVTYDPWNKRMFNNRNEAILGESGSGKSFAVNLKVFREYYAGRAKRQFIIDPEREYNTIPGANQIIFKPGSKFITNPFHIRSAILDSDVEDETADISAYLPKKISEVVDFFKWIVPDMSAEELALLSISVEDAYKEVGLDHKEHIEALPKLFPTLTDLNTEMNKYEELKRVRVILRPYIEGVYSGMFNGQTNWDLNEAINVLDIHELSEGVKKPMMDLLLKDLWEEVKRDRNEPVGLIADELWILADKKFPQTMEFIRNMGKRIRKYEGFLMVATQNVSDFIAVGEYGTAVINNCQFKTLMRLSENDVREMKETKLVTFNESEEEILSGDKPQGYCLHIVKKKRVEMRTVANETELKELNLKISYGNGIREAI